MVIINFVKQLFDKGWEASLFGILKGEYLLSKEYLFSQNMEFENAPN